MVKSVGAGACYLGGILAQDSRGTWGRMRPWGSWGSWVSSLHDAGIKSHGPQRAGEEIKQVNRPEALGSINPLEWLPHSECHRRYSFILKVKLTWEDLLCAGTTRHRGNHTNLFASSFMFGGQEGLYCR